VEIEPTEKDAASFILKSKQVMTKLKLGAVEKTDLPEACGVSLHPCVAKIGACALGKIVASPGGKLTPSTSSCSCFVRGYQDPIPLPDGSDRSFSCSFDCVDAILKYTDKYLVSVNGAGDDLSQYCQTSISVVGKEEFGNTNGYIPTDEDAGGLDVVPIDRPAVVLAGKAVGAYIDVERRAKCPVLPPVDRHAVEIAYAKHGIAEDGKGQYKMELLFGEEVFHARVAHLPKSEQLVDPSEVAEGDPSNLEGRYVVAHLTPGPCETAIGAQLAVSATGVAAINKQGLPWTAKLHAGNEGLRSDSFGMGFKPLPVEEAARYRDPIQLDATGYTVPPAYDARDVYAGQESCKAFQVMNQGACGSCYAFASAAAYSARLCRFNPGSVGNVVVSPQDLMDCTNGCDGGNPISVFNTILEKPAVETWCDPYLGKKETCGGACNDGNFYTAQTGSIRMVGGATADGVTQMQLELLRGGPGVVSFTVYDDFQAYSSGVYVKSAAAVAKGAHAVSLVGWGEEAGTPYWIIQNSWGTNWGMRGFAKIRRGTNEAGIESNGVMVVKALPPAVCSSSSCKNGASTLKSCACKCDGGWRGDLCDTCGLVCQNGGISDPKCVACTCPLGFSGAACEGGFKISPLAVKAGDGTLITASYTFGGSAAPPTQKSFLGIYPVAETKTMSTLKSVMLCGTTYNPALDGGLCPAGGGSVTLIAPTEPGSYKIALASFLPPNEFGQSGYSTLLDSAKTVALFTVLPSGAAADDLKAALVQNDPAAIMQAAVTVATRVRDQELSDMKARLDQAKAIIEKVQAEIPASVSISGVDATNPLVWSSGPPLQVCYRVPASANVNPKALVLYVGGPESLSNYPTGLTGAGVDKPLSTDYQGCATAMVSAGIPPGKYTIKLVDLTKAPIQTMLAGTTFYLSTATVSFTGYGMQGGTQLVLSTAWSIDPARASPSDTVKIVNSQGKTVYWFFTSCKCQTAPGTAAAATGQVDVSVFKTNAVPGGYTARFLPGGGAVVAATSPSWIQWARIGW
jgi:cathepsin B